MSFTANFFDLLGVNINASESEIRKAYHKRAKEFHPDKNLNNNSKLMSELTNAYRVLSDKEKRSQYLAKRTDDCDGMRVNNGYLIQPKRFSDIFRMEVLANSIRSFEQEFGTLTLEHDLIFMTDKSQNFLKHSKLRERVRNRDHACCTVCNREFASMYEKRLHEHNDEHIEAQNEDASNIAAKAARLKEKLANTDRFRLFSQLYDRYEYKQFALLLVSIVRNREADDFLILDEFLNRNKEKSAERNSTSGKLSVVELWLLRLIEAVVCAFRSRWPQSSKLFTEALLTYSDSTSSLAPLFSIVHTPWIRDGLVAASLLSPSDDNRDHLLFGILNDQIDENRRPPIDLKYENNLMETPILTIMRRSDKVMWKCFANKPNEAIFYYIDLANQADSLRSVIALYSCAVLWTIHVLNCWTKTRAEFYAYRILLRKLCVILYVLGDRSAPASRIYAFRIICSALVSAARITKTSWQNGNALMSQDEVDILDMCINEILDLSSIMPLISVSASLSYDVVYTSLICQKAFNFCLSYLLEDNTDMLNSNLSLISRNYVHYFVFEGRLRGWFSKDDDNKESDDEKKEDNVIHTNENIVPIELRHLPKTISEFYIQESRLICISKTIQSYVSIKIPSFKTNCCI